MRSNMLEKLRESSEIAVDSQTEICTLTLSECTWTRLLCSLLSTLRENPRHVVEFHAVQVTLADIDMDRVDMGISPQASRTASPEQKSDGNDSEDDETKNAVRSSTRIQHLSTTVASNSFSRNSAYSFLDAKNIDSSTIISATNALLPDMVIKDGDEDLVGLFRRSLFVCGTTQILVSCLTLSSIKERTNVSR
jgi:hypothetical protein